MMKLVRKNNLMSGVTVISLTSNFLQKTEISRILMMKKNILFKKTKKKMRIMYKMKMMKMKKRKSKRKMIKINNQFKVDSILFKELIKMILKMN